MLCITICFSNFAQNLNEHCAYGKKFGNRRVSGKG